MMAAPLCLLPGRASRAIALAAALAASPSALAADRHAGHARYPAVDEPVEHDAMDHGDMHHAHDHGEAERDRGAHEGMAHSPATAGQALPPNIPVLTDADRAAAFPTLNVHAPHGRSVNSLLLFDKLEYQDADDGSALVWDATGWIGGDIDRLWLRSEGERGNGHTERAEFQALWGHAIGPWWELVGGLRQDFKPGSAQTWAAIGIQGMPFYSLETKITAYYGEGRQTSLRLEADYDILLTNRLILQPTVEANLYGRNDRERGTGSGLGEIEAGLRLRYEFTRQFAPYVGVTWGRLYGNSEDLAREAGEDEEEARFVAGIRLWF
ncbi:copper resistance protein B [Azorhizophilus paspali]|uniref:Copper resistance protein B n=1 Tax=Azorhizophilus paspali TaxID=69963 RepID=A0ABV6SP00_AZOPA